VQLNFHLDTSLTSLSYIIYLMMPKSSVWVTHPIQSIRQSRRTCKIKER